MSSIFGESAEEMVNRLCQEWIEEETFDTNFPLTDPTLKNCLIRNLKITDGCIERAITKNNADFSSEDFRSFVKLRRENDVLLIIAQIFAKRVKVLSPPPKPAHRQPRQKLTHLRLVANQDW